MNAVLGEVGLTANLKSFDYLGALAAWFIYEGGLELKVRRTSCDTKKENSQWQLFLSCAKDTKLLPATAGSMQG